MITPMVKYQFLSYYQDFDGLVDILKSQGVVHIKQVKKGVDEELSQLKRKKVWLKQTQNLYNRFMAKYQPRTGVALNDFDSENIEDYLQQLIQIDKQIPRLEEEEFHVRFFGNYDQQKLKIIESKGLYFHLFSVGLGKVNDKWKEKYTLYELFSAGRKTYFVIISSKIQPPQIKAQTEDFPSKTISQIEIELKNLRKQKQDIITSLWHYQPQIVNFFNQTHQFVSDSLQNKSAKEQSVAMGFGKVKMLWGWVPKNKANDLEETLNNKNIYFEKENPVPSDAPPILLSNNAFSGWFEPIAKLFALPKYAELDLTPFFAPFFLLFFGLCLGDGGYGLLMFLVLLALKSKIPKQYNNLWKLALALEFVAIFMGLLSGTFFGLNLIETEIAWLTKFKSVMLTADGLFNLALILGAIQIVFGLIIKSINQFKQYGWAYSISPLGWIVLLISLATGYLTEFTSIITFLAYFGVGLIIVFSDPKASWGVKIGKGLWDLYGITGFFGDLLSYIRLFALGLAGSILGFVVNDIALSILGTHFIFGPIFFAIMLLVGHGLNIFIASLGAFVHPMRLTFVEFYKNAGFQGGGEPYQPLKKFNSNH